MRSRTRASLIATMSLLTVGAGECSVNVGEDGTKVPDQSQSVDIIPGAEERSDAIAAIEHYVDSGWETTTTQALGEQVTAALNAYDGSKIQVIGLAAGMVAQCEPALAEGARATIDELEADAPASAAYDLFFRIGSLAVEQGEVSCAQYEVFAAHRGATLYPLSRPLSE